MTVRITNYTQDQIGDRIEHRAEVDGSPFWYRLPAIAPSESRAEMFLGAALLEAMYRGEDIEIDDALALSPKLHESLPEIQRIYSGWNKDLSVVEVHARLAENHAKTSGVGSTYSGGIDSNFGFLQHEEEITHLIFASSWDSVAEDGNWEKSLLKRQKFADRYGKILLTAENNARQFSADRRISWAFQHGLTLASMVTSVGLQKVYIPSSFSHRELIPWGSHPLSDILWRTEATEIVHDGCDFSRVEKIRYLKNQQDVLDELQVCWWNVLSNCGTCPKCLRTSLALQLLGATSARIPEIDSQSRIRGLRPNSARELAFVWELPHLAKDQGDAKVISKLRRLQRRYKLRAHRDELIKTLVGPGVVHFIRLLRHKDWHPERSRIEKI